jgi:hypothetical protein
VCLLDVEDGERLRRLDSRDRDRWRPAEREAFLGWAACPEVLTDGGWVRMVWQRWSSWTAGDPRWTTGLIDTTRGAPATTAARVRAWIEEHRSAGR